MPQQSKLNFKFYIMRKFTFFLLGTLLSLSVFAQTADNKWAIGLGYGTMQYSGELGNQFLAYFGKDELGGRDWQNSYQLQLARYLNPSFEAMLRFNYSYLKEMAGTNGVTYRLSGEYFNAGAEVHYKFNNGYILREDFFLQPYLSGGIGLLTGNSELNKVIAANKSVAGITTGEEKVTAFHPYLGLGTKIRITPGFNFFVEVGAMPTANDKFDLTKDNQITDNAEAEGFFERKGGDDFMKLTMGVNIGLGKAKDSDGDGVPDRKDKCPDTPAGVAVDKDGCPLDRDGDGVPDYKDDCPDTPGLASLKGCPDRDGDGIADKDDECPDTPGLKKFNGCPDTDGDGVPDPKDACPDTPKGCPVDEKGCPLDSDGDGVIDCQDNCPNEPGSKENKGCPEGWVTIELSPVYFDFDKADLKPEGKAELDKLVEQLNTGKQYDVVIAGHTCNIGTEKYNQGLSEKRAQAVVKYLTMKGINNAYVGAKGYGESKPAVKNDSTPHRKLNRRAEMEVKIKK